MTPSPFSPDFQTSRQRFIDAARACGAQLESHDYPARGPQGEALGTDLAWIGPRDAGKVLVLASGTHGVEGFCGAGAQLDWLQRGEATRLSPDAAVLLIHAVNPYGFAWHRRVTHENVDLNRSWIDFSQGLPPRPAYDTLAEALCPAEWTDASRARAAAFLKERIAQMGMKSFVAAVSGGQYHHPDGLFFGGTQPCAARRTLEAVLTGHLGRARRLAIIDFHSGLGPRGYGELMMTATAASEAFARARRWYGASVTPVGTERSASAALSGDWLSATPGLLPQAVVTAIAIEFGTVDALTVLEALRADNWAHAHGGADEAWPQPIKKAMLDAFYVDDPLWQGMVLGQSLAATRQALAGLAAED